MNKENKTMYVAVNKDKKGNSYDSFKEWSLANGYSDDKEIDKDTICNRDGIEPKIYSPITCLWVSKEENLKQRTGSDKYRIKTISRP